MKSLRNIDLGSLINAPFNAPNAVHLTATDPTRSRRAGDMYGTSEWNDNVANAFEQEINKHKTDPLIPTPVETVVTPETRMQAAIDTLSGRSGSLASNSYAVDANDPLNTSHKININPNADESYLYHELGHVANMQGGLGKRIRELRDNPKDLAKALQMASFIAPVGAAALIPGDDDLGVAMGVQAATMAPTLLDEAMASNTALRLMKNAGGRASLGQRGKLAGAYLSYLGPLITKSAMGYGIGNLADDELTSLLGYGQ